MEIAKFYDIGTLNLVIQQIFKGNLTFFTLRAFETAKGQIWIRIFLDLAILQSKPNNLVGAD